MKLRLLANLGRALAACLLPAAAAAAQAAPAAQLPAPATFVVQVVYREGVKPSYLEVPGCVWYADFGRTPAAAARAAGDAVHAVDVKSKLEGGRVELKVGVHVGARFFDRLDEVATYTAAPGETVEARDLERVGVAPFVFRVLRVGASDTAAPTVDNRTRSVAAAVTAFTSDPLPRARLTLTNLSPKRVRAVAMRTVFDGRPRASILAYQPEGRPLMEPGGAYEREIGVTDGRPSASGFTPAAIEGVIVEAAVFEDYTFEGDADRAARKACMDEGERVQLPRLLRLFRAARAGVGPDEAAAVRGFRAAVAALDDVAPQASVDAMLSAHPGLSPVTSRGLREVVEVSMHYVRAELLKDLERFARRPQAAPAGESFEGWLARQQARHEDWLARL